MNSYFITPQATQDLEEIHDFIVEDSTSAALKLLDLFEEKFQMIAQSPEMGRKREELALALRSFPAGRYVIFYRCGQNRIEVIRVLHGSRDIETILEEE